MRIDSSTISHKYSIWLLLGECDVFRMLLKPILGNLDPMTQCIFLLEQSIVVEVHGVHEEGESGYKAV